MPDDLFARIRAEEGPRCSTCGGPRDRPRQRTCRACHRLYMRAWRKAHPLTGEALRKARARSYAGTYLRRGKITRRPCERCGSDDAQMHHPDYDRPLDVTWLCRPCHMDLHDTETIPGPDDPIPEPYNLAAMEARNR